MNSRWHLIISNLKSSIRIISAIFSIVYFNWLIIAYGFIIAEILGIIEEIGDKR
jgi:hypothetical protein